MALTGHSYLKVETLLKALSYTIAFTSFMSVFMHIGLIYRVITVAFALISLYMDFRTERHLPRNMITLMSVLIILTSFYRVNLDDPALPLIEGLSLLLFIKFMEEKGFRDYMQIYAIALFLLAGSALFNVDITFLIYFVLLLFLTAIATVTLTFYAEDRKIVLNLKAAIKMFSTALFIPLVSIPMMASLFIILPRTNYPLFSFLNRPDRGLTGFTDNIRLGDVSDIQADNSIILRVSMKPIAENQLYWRGAALDLFDGKVWSRSKGVVNDRINPSELKGEAITQGVFLEAYDNNYLFALDRPYYIDLKGARVRNDLTIALDRNVNRRIRYEVRSLLSPELKVQEIDRNRYLQLPDTLPLSIRDLALSLASGRDEKETVNRVVGFLNSESFKYSLMGLPITDNPIEEFLFKYRYGNCEYYASSAAVLLRAVGLPSRLVVGYKGGYYNPIGAYYAVTQESAHVWVEVFLGHSWVRIDPTPGSQFVSQAKRPLWLVIRLYSDTINYYWNQVVITYDFQKQFRGFMMIQGRLKGLRQADINVLKGEAGTVLYVIATVTVLLLLVYLVKGRKNVTLRLVEEYERRMAKRGFLRRPNQGLREFTDLIGDRDIRQRAMLFVNEIERVFYKDEQVTKTAEKRLRDLLQAL